MLRSSCFLPSIDVSVPCKPDVQLILGDVGKYTTPVAQRRPVRHSTFTVHVATTYFL